MRTLALTLTTMNAMWAATIALYALKVLAQDEVTFGFLLAAASVGSAVEGVTAAPLV